MVNDKADLLDGFKAWVWLSCWNTVVKKMQFWLVLAAKVTVKVIWNFLVNDILFLIKLALLKIIQNDVI